jgi:hypothetical protein
MSGRRGLNLSAAQVIAGVLATLSAAVAASFLGVAGTLLGAALGSVFSTMGTEIYKHYLQRSEERLRTAGQVLYHSAAKTKTGDTPAQAGAASGGRHAAYQGSAGQQGVTRQLGNRDAASQDPANQETAVWDRRQYGTPRDPYQTETLSGSGTQWRGAAYGGGTNGGSPNGGATNGGATNGGSPNGWNGSADSAGQHANGSITPEGADGDAAGHGGVWSATTSFFSSLTRRQWLTYGGIAAGLFIVVIAGIVVFQLAVGRPPLGSPVGHTARQQQRTTHPSSTPSATPTGSASTSPTPSSSPSSGTPTPTSGTPSPGSSGASSSPSTVPSPTPSTGSSGAARTPALSTPAP